LILLELIGDVDCTLGPALDTICSRKWFWYGTFIKLALETGVLLSREDLRGGIVEYLNGDC